LISKTLNFGSLAELGSVFYSVKEKNFDSDRSTKRRVDREFSKKAELEMAIAQEREQYVFPLFVAGIPQLSNHLVSF
jgi:hypothetical protein